MSAQSARLRPLYIGVISSCFFHVSCLEPWRTWRECSSSYVVQYIRIILLCFWGILSNSHSNDKGVNCGMLWPQMSSSVILQRTALSKHLAYSVAIQSLSAGGKWRGFRQHWTSGAFQYVQISYAFIGVQLRNKLMAVYDDSRELCGVRQGAHWVWDA